MTVAEQIGKNLRRIRRGVDMSQSDLARRSGIHPTEVSLLERGSRIPRVDIARAAGSCEGNAAGLTERERPLFRPEARRTEAAKNMTIGELSARGGIDVVSIVALIRGR